MKKQFVQLVLGLTFATLLIFLWNVLDHSTYSVQAQGGTGVVRVAKTGIDTSGCGSVATPCQTLQFAIDQASANEEIRVSAGIYTQVQQKSAPAGYEGSAILTQTIYISKNLVIRGGYTTTNWLEPNPISNPTIVDALGLGRVVVVHGTDNVLIEGLRLTGGDAANLGGIPFFVSDAGGGFYMLSGKATLSNTQIVSNTATAGGGLWNNGQLTLINSTVSTNTAKNGGQESAGGGISSEGGILIIENSTIFNNSAEHVGGGISHAGSIMGGASSILTATNSTIVGNIATYGGGGIYSDSDIFLNNVTISENIVDPGNEFTGGGGIMDDGVDVGGFKIQNSIIAGNIDNSAINKYPDCDQVWSIVSLGHNLVEDETGCEGVFTATNDITGTNAQLGPLADNGGLTLTQALLSDSLAVNAGNNATCPATDQRGIARPQGVSCDIGAYESLLLPSLTLSKTVQLSNNPIQPGDPLTYTIVVANNGIANANGVVVSDTLPTYIDGADLYETVNISASTGLTFTLNVTLSKSVPLGEVITNTAFFSHTSGSNQASSIFSVKKMESTYLPVILKN